MRIIGVCFGHQIVGRAMGARLGRNERGWEASVVDVDLTPKGKEIFGKDTLVRPIFPSFLLFGLFLFLFLLVYLGMGKG